MKWAKVKPTLKIASHQEADDKASYKYYTLDELKKTFESNKENIWVVHPFEYDFKDPKNYEKFQKEYETFCGGYLYYYDMIVRSNTIDHVIHFRWKPYNEKGKYTITIFLWPAPGRAKNCPIPDIAHEYADTLLEKTSVMEDAKQLSVQGNGTLLKADTITAPQGGMQVMMDTSGGSDGFDTGIDPPTPPGPPPPPRH